MDEAELVDFDYSVRLCLSSSTLSHMKKPLLMLDLSLKVSPRKRNVLTGTE